MAETSYVLDNMISNLFGDGDVILTSYLELVKPAKEETRTPEEILRHIEDKLRAM